MVDRSTWRSSKEIALTRKRDDSDRIAIFTLSATKNEEVLAFSFFYMHIGASWYILHNIPLFENNVMATVRFTTHSPRSKHLTVVKKVASERYLSAIIFGEIRCTPESVDTIPIHWVHLCFFKLSPRMKGETECIK
jgi:hypothetical protein